MQARAAEDIEVAGTSQKDTGVLLSERHSPGHTDNIGKKYKNYQGPLKHKAY